MLSFVRTSLFLPLFHVVKRNIASINNSRTARSDTNTNNIVWIDMEMTGLDVINDHILEIACIVTDSKLNIISEGPDIIVHQDDSILNNMDEWCVTQHGRSGLTEASRKSSIDIQEAENIILSFIKQHAPEKRCPLGGNSVYMDRLFLYKYMPTLNEYLHYRIIDVSTVKELCKRWCENEYKNIPTKSFAHRALSDIKESIAELKYYKDNVIKTKIT